MGLLGKAFEHFNRRVLKCKRGGGGTTITNSAPPAPTVTDTMGDYVNSLPELYQAQLQYEPQMQAMNLQMLQDYGTQFGEAYRDINASLYPETAALQEQLAGQATEGMEQGLTPEEMQQYRELYSSQLGTNAGSGMGADYMGSSLVQANQQRKDYYRNLGLSVAGRQPLAQGGTTGQTNWMQQYQPAQALGNQASNYGSWANSFESAYSPSPWGQIGAGVATGIGNMGSAAMMR